MSQDTRPTSFDPFGEPIACQHPLTESQAERRGFGETKRAVAVFWVIALMFVAGRAYWADQQASANPSSVAAARVTVIR